MPILFSKLPPSVPPSPTPTRQWRGVLAERSPGTWYTNTSSLERDVHIVTDNLLDGGYVNIQIRADAASNVYNIIGNSTSLGDLTSTTRAVGQASIPPGWQYSVSAANLGTRTIASWFELSV